MKKYMKIALKEANKAFKKNEIPIGAVIVKNGKIVAKAHNMREKKHISTYHAEIIAINKACKKMKNWRLNDCELYVTVEPCMMCCGAIIQSRLSTVIYGTQNENYGYSQVLIKNDVKLIGDVCKEECKKIIQNFFVKKRNQNL